MTARTPLPSAGKARMGLTYLTLGALTLILLSFTPLTLRARWQGDEYLLFHQLHQHVWTFTLWLFRWSPRPWSNTLLITYGLAVNALHRPLTSSVILPLWAALAAAIIIPALTPHSSPLHGQDQAGATRKRLRLTLALALLCLFLLGHPISEMFLWPAGSLSYIPTLTGAVWIFWQLADGLPNRITASLALTLAAGSSEAGAFLALTTTACLLITHPRHLRRHIWLLPAILVASIDLTTVLQGRVGTLEMNAHANPYLHHARASLLAAIPHFAWSLIALNDQEQGWQAIVTGVQAKALILLGARECLKSPATQGTARPLIALAVSLLLANFITIAAAYYQFGSLCCERHDCLRQCFTILALAALGAAWSAHRLPRERPVPVLILFAVLTLYSRNADGLIAEYRLIAPTQTARTQTWQSGLSAGNSMIFTLPPAGPLVGGPGFAPGQYHASKDTPWHFEGVLDFFGKTSMNVQPLP